MIESIVNMYKIAVGFSGRKIMNKSTVYIVSFIYLLVFVYLGLFYEVKWMDNHTPYSILFGGYREILVTSYSSIISFIFVIMFFFQILWLGVQAKNFYNMTTVKLLNVYRISGIYLYIGFLVKRMKDLLIITLIFLMPIILLYLISSNIFHVYLVLYSFILFYGSFILLCIFDFIFLCIKRPEPSSVITILLLLTIPLISFVLRPLILEYSVNPEILKLLDIFPDVLSIGYQYILLSFSSSYSLSKIIYPSIFTLILLFINLRMSKNSLSKFLTN